VRLFLRILAVPVFAAALLSGLAVSLIIEAARLGWRCGWAEAKR